MIVIQLASMIMLCEFHQPWKIWKKKKILWLEINILPKIMTYERQEQEQHQLR